MVNLDPLQAAKKDVASARTSLASASTFPSFLSLCRALIAFTTVTLLVPHRKAAVSHPEYIVQQINDIIGPIRALFSTSMKLGTVTLQGIGIKLRLGGI